MKLKLQKALTGREAVLLRNWNESLSDLWWCYRTKEATQYTGRIISQAVPVDASSFLSHLCRQAVLEIFCWHLAKGLARNRKEMTETGQHTRNLLKSVPMINPSIIRSSNHAKSVAILKPRRLSDCSRSVQPATSSKSICLWQAAQTWMSPASFTYITKQITGFHALWIPATNITCEGSIEGTILECTWSMMVLTLLALLALLDWFLRMSKLSADIAICCTIASGGQKEKGRKAEQIVVRQRVFSFLHLKTWITGKDLPYPYPLQSC